MFDVKLMPAFKSKKISISKKKQKVQENGKQTKEKSNLLNS